MGRIYEALMRAAKEREESQGKSSLPSIEDRTSPQSPLSAEEEMLALIESIESLLIAQRRKIIQIIGSREGKRASCIATEFAGFSASKIGLSVLHVDPKKLHAWATLCFSMTLGGVNTTAVSEMEGIDERFRQSQDNGFFVMEWNDRGNYNPVTVQPDSLRPCLEYLRGRFDLIVIDVASNSDSTECLATAGDVDLTVLVFESDKVEWTKTGDVEDVGLALVMESIERGILCPQKVIKFRETSLLLLVPFER